MKMTPLMAGLAMLGLITACDNDDDNEEKPQQGIFYGNTVNVGNGKARSFISHTDEHDRMELGIIMTAAALEGLSANEQEFELDLPKEAAGLTPFDHIALGWMSHGHPDPVYHHPHFDIHFYMISKAEQETISPDKPEMGLNPDSNFLPKQYINPDVIGIPKMGKHWVDATGPEFQPGGKFTTAFLMGTYNRKVVFWEPMITREYLASEPDTVMAVPQPKAFQQKSHYPTRYEIRFDRQKQEYRILLSGFEHR